MSPNVSIRHMLYINRTRQSPFQLDELDCCNKLNGFVDEIVLCFVFFLIAAIMTVLGIS